MEERPGDHAGHHPVTVSETAPRVTRDAAMGRSYRWILIGTWTHATGKTIGCYVNSIGSEKLRPDEANRSQHCAIEDASNERASTYNVKMKGPELALRLCTKDYRLITARAV